MGDVAAPSTTIVPFANTALLPSCAVDCGALYDANGGCVPPVIDAARGTAAFTACFCANTAVAALSTAVTGVCDTACSSVGLTSIANWFRNICSVDDSDDNGGNKNADESSTTTTTTATSGSGKSGSSGGGGGDWISNHWQWVIFLVILVVAIAGIWIGACIWRRRYLRKKDRQLSLGQKHSGSASHPSWGPGIGPDAVTTHDPAYDSQRNSHAILTSTSATAPVQEKAPKTKDKKRWIVSERT
ncbi:hypothetical protein QQZ08_003589 [Neonectria magnoliae]|uniref:Integral membrane protein n=1 Tax=Neonectria magnoliae TaxID=2732573 RepID=A0ABR1IAP2_9HYPO